MTYPTDIPAFQAALLNYQAPEDLDDVQETIVAAQSASSVVVQSVRVFNKLRGQPDLDPAGLRLLLGAAHLIASGGWHGLAAEAATVLAQRAAELAE